MGEYISEDEEEIIVSAAMVSAGLAELFPCELKPYQDEAEVLGRVFRAMVKLSQYYPP